MSDPTPQLPVDDLRPMLAAIQEKVNVRTAEISSGIAELHTLVRTRLDTLDAEQIKIRSEIMSRIDRLQDTVEFVREDIRVNWHTADNAVNRARTSREEIERLTELISAMDRRYQLLAS